MLLELEESRKTGALDISNASARVRLYIDSGRIIDADEGTVGETLGRILLREKVIDQQQYNDALERMAELRAAGTPSKLGEIFVDLKILTKEQVFAALAAQVQQKALRALAWPSARFRFVECLGGPLTLEERFVTHAEPLILAALKLADRDALDALLVQAWDRYPALRVSPAPLSRRASGALEPSAAERVDAFRLSDADAAFAHSLDGTRTVRSLLETKSDDGADHAVVLAALLFTDLLDLHAARVLPPRPAVPRPASSRRELAAAPMPPPPPSSGSPIGPETPKAPMAPLLAEKAYQNGKRLVHEGRFTDASAELRRAARLYNAVEYELWAIWAETRADEKHEERHIEELRKVAQLAIEEDTERGFATFVLGYLARRAGDPKEAEVLFERARALDPDAIAEGWDALLRPLPFASTRGEVKALAPLLGTPSPPAVRPATDDEETVPIATLRGLATEEALVAAREQEKRIGRPPPVQEHESLPSIPSMPVAPAMVAPEAEPTDEVDEPAPHAFRGRDERSVAREKTRRAGRAIIIACVIAAGFGIALLLSFVNPGDYTPATDPFKDSGLDSAPARAQSAAVDAASATLATASDAQSTVDEARDGSYADSATSIPSEASIVPAADAEHGVLVTPPAAESHRIYVDGRIAGTTPPLVVVPCGRHTVKIGSQGREQSVQVPCGGSIDVEYP